MRRVFIAVRPPSEVAMAVHERLCTKIPAGGWKVVPAENLHITMLFIGHVDESAFSGIREKMGRVRGAFPGKFDAELRGTGGFNGRVLWLGVREGAEMLEKIAGALRESFGLGGEKFSPHMTLARAGRSRGADACDVLRALGNEDFSARFKAEGIDLMESALMPEGPKYSQVFRLCL